MELFTNYSRIVCQAKYKANKGKGLKGLSPKQMFQRFPIALAQMEAGNTSENLQNETRKIIYCLYQKKEITKKTYRDIMTTTKLYI